MSELNKGVDQNYFTEQAFNMEAFAKEHRGSSFRLRLAGAWENFQNGGSVSEYISAYNDICKYEEVGSTFVDDLSTEVNEFVFPKPKISFLSSPVKSIRKLLGLSYA